MHPEVHRQPGSVDSFIRRTIAGPTHPLDRSGAAPERLLGSFELTFEDDWRIALWYLDTLETWEVFQDDPFELAFCEAGLSPWPLTL
ncbi:MAG: hypothetical protein ACXWDS_01535, partial [Actinomycetota bacterium]